MIKPTNIDALNMSDSITYKCNECGHTGEISVQKFSTENWEKEYEASPIGCPNCRLNLSIK